MITRLVQWNGLFNNTPCFIIGTAPSVTQINLSVLKDYLTIGINTVCNIFDPVILMWQDRCVYNTNRSQIDKSQSVKLCRQDCFKNESFREFILTEKEFKIPVSTANLHGTGSTGPLAFQLAFLMGCNPIVLIGLDGKYNSHKTNFWGHNWMHPTNATKIFTDGLLWIKKYEKERIIFNCSDNDIFDKKYTLEEAVESIKPHPFGQNFFKTQLMEH